MFKNKLIIIFVFISLIILIGVTFYRYFKTKEHSLKNEDQSLDKIIIKINDFDVTARRVKEEMDNVLSIKNPSLAKVNIDKSILDYFFTVGLLVTEAQKTGFFNDHKIQNRLIECERLNLIESTRQYEIDLQEVTENELRQCYKRASEKLLLDHVWMKFNDKKICNEIVERYNQSKLFPYMYKLITNEYYPHFIANSSIFITVGELSQKLEQIVYNMGIGENKAIQTENDCHFFHLLKRIDSGQGTYKEERENLRERVALRKLIENGDPLFNQAKMAEKLTINKTILSSIDFFVKPLPEKYYIDKTNDVIDDKKVIAVISGREITVSNLKSKVARLPMNIQVHFFNNKTKADAVKTLLFSYSGHALSRPYGVKGKDIELLYSDIFEKMDTLYINLHAVNKIDFTKQYQSKILASKGRWNLTISRFYSELLKLAEETREELKKQNQLCRFIEYLAELENVGNSEDDSLFINRLFMEYIDYFQNDDLLSNTSSYFMDSDVVASFDSVFITVQGLRERVLKMLEPKKDMFLNNETRFNAVKSLLIEEAWLRRSKRYGLASEPVYIQRSKEKKQWLIAREFFRSNIFNNNISLTDTGFDTLLHSTTYDKAEKKLRRLLNPLIKSATVYVDTNALREYGILVDSSLFIQDISWICKTLSSDFHIKINFQPPNIRPPSGYKIDSGLEYGERENGFCYGWDIPVTDLVRNHKGYHENILYSANIYFQKYGGRKWELSVPNNTYIVTLLAGDAEWTDHINNLDVEGIELTDTDGKDNFDTYIFIVTVRDGRLTIKPSRDAFQSRLCFVEVEQYL